MIEFNYETDFQLTAATFYVDWINRVIYSEKKSLGNLNFIFCADDFLLDMNKKYLDHDTYTDIITFDYCEGVVIAGDIFISIDRVKENANDFNVSFDSELLKVMAHGMLHLMGYKDKSEEDIIIMRSKEDEKTKLFHVEH